ncbi:hypothetical protein E5F05_06875 [Deinococcus metallilatus]|uniref:Uncharacterized protein n=1 Tax=Deinococcus metallilatus TaxID=1211322 RepID=A0AAJ5JYZ9_9DEIO|nr:hypothetical protein [Deinococcus metallilatus]MBB5294669.1 hypothetical protein [Deinococcus metallilatus]QBY07704.1 hypothetical protein E5F05_06875 [Deinococcus metallilatus]RXJ14120.1 hypothetical protein ERJ73_05710 [Deinococcus metallilatus]TLK30085.1 hypothetical protein FCS05_06025 [Deinococcus metallilatus]GMA15885.1 hypothetical protein GCM10025871_22160 [Deinococcus metallilatus]
MPDDLAHAIIRRAQELDGRTLDAQAQHLGAKDWRTLTEALTFHESSTGGGLAMLTAALPAGHLLVITDGEADLPTNINRFRLDLLDPDDQEILHVQHSGDQQN